MVTSSDAYIPTLDEGKLKFWAEKPLKRKAKVYCKVIDRDNRLPMMDNHEGG